MNDLVIYEDNKIIVSKDAVKKIQKLYTLKAELDMLEKELKAQALELMEKYDKKPIIAKGLTIVYRDGYIRKSVDNEKLKKDGLYEKYLKETDVKGTVAISVDL